MLVVQVHEQNHTLMHSFFPGQILEDLLNHQKIIFIKIIIFFFLGQLDLFYICISFKYIYIFKKKKNPKVAFFAWAWELFMF